MIGIRNDFKKLSKQRKFYLYGLIVFAMCILAFGIKATYAYYSMGTDPKPMLAAIVGDFDSGSGDINIIIYKQVDGQYVKTYGVPTVGYRFNDSLTKCSNPETYTEVTCTNGSTGNCRYNYNESTREFSLTSNQKVTCKFYFEQTMSSDIDVYIMIENDNVVDKTHEVNNVNKNYQLVNSVPESGYTYVDGECEQTGGTISYSDSKITVSSTVKNKCYAYFNKTN